MTVHDLVTEYNVGGAMSKSGDVGKVSRVITGALLKAVVKNSGLTPVSGDTYKILKLGKYQFVREVTTIVTKEDDTSIALDIGYTDGTNASTTAFETDAALQTRGSTVSSDDTLLIDDDGYYLTITPSTLTGMDDALEFIVSATIQDMSDLVLSTAITTPV